MSATGALVIHNRILDASARARASTTRALSVTLASAQTLN
jgi:hypothetical protein